MKIHKGFKDIKVKVLNIDENLLEHAYMFGRFGRDSYKFPSEEYTKDELEDFYDELVDGVTFPKYCFEGTRIDFQIEGISRICLAQLTRDNAIFCSESHGLRPLSMDINLPLSITNDKQVMEKVVAAQRLLEEAYCIACEHELPYPETRYIGLHSQTISCNAAFTPMAFRRACFSRTNNSFCDELNYVYRKMYNEVRNAIDSHCDTLNKQLWRWLLPEKGCIDDNYYKRTNVFNGDFNWTELPDGPYRYIPAQNDWRKSGWKLELERIYDEEPYLLTEKEKVIVEGMLNTNSNTLPSTYDGTVKRVAKNAIKDMNYYKEAKNEGRL